jgi:hypothetical protein
MVASSVLVALLLAAPSLAVPLARSSEPLSARDAAAIEEIVDLAARDPKFRFGRIFGKITHAVGSIAKVAAPIASNFIREDVEPEFTARDLAILDSYRDLAARDPSFGSFFHRIQNTVNNVRHTVSSVAKGAIPIINQFTREVPDLELTERDFAYFDELAARDPNFWHSFKSVVGKVAKIAKPAARIAAGILIRDDGMESVLELSERDLEELDDLAARDPKFRFGRIFGKITHAVGSIAKVAAPIASNFIREDGDEALSARDLEEFVEIAARDPKFRFGRVFGKITHAVSSIAKVAAPIASNFIREEDMEDFAAREEFSDVLELSERDLEALEELAARDPNFFHSLKHIVSRVSKVARPIAGIASNFIREDAEFDEVLAREYDLAALD